jgi:hypothetical protein
MLLYNHFLEKARKVIYTTAADAGQLEALVIYAYANGRLRFLAPRDWILSLGWPFGANGIIGSTVLKPTPQ